MAVKRMFSIDVTETDTFLDMPLTAQALYFHLGMMGDDDGFVSNPRSIVRVTGCSENDLKTLENRNSCGSSSPAEPQFSSISAYRGRPKRIRPD